MELLIALLLIGTMLSLLLRFFSNTLQMDRKIDAVRKEAFAREHLQIRLLHFFSSILPRSTLPDTSAPSLYTLEGEFPGLAAIFDNGIDPDPRFSGTVQGEIALDGEKNLFLSVRPLSESPKKACRKELLLQNVQTLKFQFLSKKNEDSSKGNASFDWLASWPKNRWDTPSIIRLIAKTENEDLSFAFSLPFSQPITYERKET